MAAESEARLLDGKSVAAALRESLAARVAQLGYAPGLAVVLVGDDPASAIYVRNKERAAAKAGFESHVFRLSADTPEADLLDLIARLNDDPAIDGILVQLPLPKQIRADRVIRAIDPAKDVDGFHPENVAALALGAPRLVPCTPRGVMKLLEAAGVAPRGARALVVGRSGIVGRPMAQLLLNADATVTIAHSRTRDLAAECRRAEILVAAAGRPRMIAGNWVAPGAVVIDVGINRLADGSLAGDVDFASASKVAGWITPVPGGVGPMTIACLLENTLTAAEARRAA